MSILSSFSSSFTAVTSNPQSISFLYGVKWSSKVRGFNSCGLALDLGIAYVEWGCLCLGLYCGGRTFERMAEEKALKEDEEKLGRIGRIADRDRRDSCSY